MSRISGSETNSYFNNDTKKTLNIDQSKTDGKVDGLKSNNLKNKVKASPEDLKGSMAFKFPGLAHAKKHAAIEKQRKETEYHRSAVPEQFSAANQLKSMARENGAFQVAIKGSAKAVGITASGISKMT